jgi:hypothetical protein
MLLGRTCCRRPDQGAAPHVHFPLPLAVRRLQPADPVHRTDDDMFGWRRLEGRSESQRNLPDVFLIVVTNPVFYRPLRLLAD